DKNIDGFSAIPLHRKYLCYEDDMRIIFTGSPLQALKSFKPPLKILNVVSISSGLCVNAGKPEIISGYGGLIEKIASFKISGDINILGSWIGNNSTAMNLQDLKGK
ncbi:Hypothetical protein FKW44_009113, partial [Caligus rogercresseyi]